MRSVASRPLSGTRRAAGCWGRRGRWAAARVAAGRFGAARFSAARFAGLVAAPEAVRLDFFSFERVADAGRRVAAFGAAARLALVLEGRVALARFEALLLTFFRGFRMVAILSFSMIAPSTVRGYVIPHS